MPEVFDVVILVAPALSAVSLNLDAPRRTPADIDLSHLALRRASSSLYPLVSSRVSIVIGLPCRAMVCSDSQYSMISDGMASIKLFSATMIRRRSNLARSTGSRVTALLLRWISSKFSQPTSSLGSATILFEDISRDLSCLRCRMPVGISEIKLCERFSRSSLGSLTIGLGMVVSRLWSRRSTLRFFSSDKPLGMSVMRFFERPSLLQVVISAI